MQQRVEKLNLMIAYGAERPWSFSLARSLASLPVDLHRSRTDSEAVAMAATGRMHVAVVDDSLSGSGCLDFVRRVRQMGIALPSLLVCDRADSRFLRDALSLDVFSVVQPSYAPDLLASMVLKAVRRIYRLDWRLEGMMN